MKHTITNLAIMIVAAAAITPAAAQKDYKFGNVTKAELLRSDFPDIADGAKMIVLDEYIEANLRRRNEIVNGVDWRQTTTTIVRTVEFFDTKKIKILEPTTSGVTEITFTLANNETLLFKRIKAVHYALHNNRLVKRKLSTKDIKQILLPDSSRCYSFVIPNAKAGDIFEFKYSKIIELTDADIYDLSLQQDIPVLAIRCDLATIERSPYYTVNDFNKLIFRTGKYPISERRESGMKMYSTTPLAVTRAKDISPILRQSAGIGASDIFIYEATDLPAITNESDGEIAKIRVIFNGDSPE